MDEQSALPSIYGAPAWAAVAIGVLGAILGIAVDHFVGSGELTARFAVIYLLGCTFAALAVRHRALFTAVVQPPIILFVAVPLAYMTFSGASLSFRSMALNVIPLVNRFPLMLFATTVVMTIGAIRLLRNRPRRLARPAAEHAAPSDRADRAERASTTDGTVRNDRPATSMVRPVAAHHPESAETERIAASRRRSASRATGNPRTNGTPRTTGTSRAAVTSPPLSATGQASGDWLASVEPLASRPTPASREDGRETAAADRPPAAERTTRRTPPRTDTVGGAHRPVRYRADGVGAHGSDRDDADDATAEPLFDDAPPYAVRRTRAGRRFQPEPRVPEHPIPSVRYRGDPPAGY